MCVTTVNLAGREPKTEPGLGQTLQTDVYAATRAVECLPLLLLPPSPASQI